VHINMQLHCFVLTQDNRPLHLISRDTRHSKMDNNLEVQANSKIDNNLGLRCRVSASGVWYRNVTERDVLNSSWKLTGILILLLSITVLV